MTTTTTLTTAERADLHASTAEVLQQTRGPQSALSVTLLALAERLRAEADAHDQSKAQRAAIQYQSDRVVAVAQMYEAIVQVEAAGSADPDHLAELRRCVAELMGAEPDDRIRVRFSNTTARELISEWLEGRAYGYGYPLQALAGHCPAAQARREREHAEAIAQVGQILARSDWVAHWSGERLEVATDKSSADRRPGSYLCNSTPVPADHPRRAELEAAANFLRHRQQVWDEAERAKELTAQQARDRTFQALAAYVLIDMSPTELAEVQESSVLGKIRRWISPPLIARADARPDAGSKVDRVSVEAYRAKRDLVDHLQTHAQKLANAAGVSDAVSVEVDCYERRRDNDGDKRWTVDLTVHIGPVAVPFREIILD